METETMDKTINSSTVQAKKSLSVRQEASGREASSREASSREASSKTSVDTAGMDHIIFRKLTLKTNSSAGQKDITNRNDIQKILDYIAAAPKNQQVEYDNAPGTLYHIECPETLYAATLYHNNILFYEGAYYQMDQGFADNLQAIFESVDASAENVQF